jgi:hypothetical protein
VRRAALAGLLALGLARGAAHHASDKPPSGLVRASGGGRLVGQKAAFAVQPFVSAGSYADYKELARPGTYEFNRYGAGQISYDEANSRYVIDPDGAGSAPSFTVSQPNFNVRSLRGNAVMRWDYRPGSSLYFVWQQERSGFEPIGDFDGRRDVDAIFRTIPRNVFLVKATYWMGK